MLFPQTGNGSSCEEALLHSWNEAWLLGICACLLAWPALCSSNLVFFVGVFCVLGVWAFNAHCRQGRRVNVGGNRRLKLHILSKTNMWKSEEAFLDKFANLPSALVKAQATEKKKEAHAEKRDMAQQNKDILDALEVGEAPSSIQARLQSRVFLFDFEENQGRSIKKKLRDLEAIVSFILHIATPSDEAVVRISSCGGSLVEYGLATEHLLRLSRSVRLTACVDQFAASGGLMMAIAAQRVVAAPFACLGSIGVTMAVPNFSQIMKHNNIQYVQLTAGKWKRTIGPFSEITGEAIDKAQEKLCKAHDAFKRLVQERRGLSPIQMLEVATGETFLGTEAKTCGLVDDLATSSEILDGLLAKHDVIHLARHDEKGSVVQTFLHQIFGKVEIPNGLLSFASLGASDSSSSTLETFETLYA